MRTFKEFMVDIVRKPIILFPLIGLAHILWLLWIVWTNRDVPIYYKEWLQAAWMLGYTICWIAVCDMRRWGALSYMALTLTNVVLYLAVKDQAAKNLYMSPIFLIDDVFSFFLLYFYKRFR